MTPDASFPPLFTPIHLLAFLVIASRVGRVGRQLGADNYKAPNSSSRVCSCIQSSQPCRPNSVCSPGALFVCRLTSERAHSGGRWSRRSGVCRERLADARPRRRGQIGSEHPEMRSATRARPVAAFQSSLIAELAFALPAAPENAQEQLLGQLGYPGPSTTRR